MGTFGPAKQIDIFSFATNSNITNLEELGMNITFNNCEWSSTSIGWIGGGHGSGATNYSWEISLDKEKWLNGANMVTIEAYYKMQAGSAPDAYHPYYSNAYGGIGIDINENWEWVQTPNFRPPNSYTSPYWREFNVSKTFYVPDVSSIKLKGWGYDADFVSSDSYLTNIIIKFESI